MPQRNYVNLGEVRIKEIEVPYYKCPTCKSLSTSLVNLECIRCKHNWTDEELKDENNIAKIKTEVLICPRCHIEIEKTSDNKADIGYICYKCHSVLEYTDYPSHGTSDQTIRLIKTTDYFHGKHHDCDGMMILGHSVKIDKGGNKSILKIPLECTKCGYRDLVKIGAEGDVTIITEEF